jgi:hypothetical protein
MPDFASSTVVILLASLLGVAVLLLMVLFGISRSLSRIERRLGDPLVRDEGVSSGPSLAERSAGGAFETFLSEDPARRKLPKGEQFAAYRQWRQDKGMNWSNS